MWKKHKKNMAFVEPEPISERGNFPFRFGEWGEGGHHFRLG